MSQGQGSFIEPATGDSVGGSDEFEPLEITGSEASLQKSLASAIYRHSYENGRRYHYFRNGKYPIPNDDLEQDRDDLKHAMVKELTDGTLVHAPIGDNPQKILDLGTGTGIWAMEVGDKYPNAKVYGVDLSPIQPVWVPPNVKFIIDDVEDDWLTTEIYDYIHVRNLVPFLRNVPGVLNSCIQNMLPGGWIEVCDLGADVGCDDGTMPDGWPVHVFWARLNTAMRNLGSDLQIAPRIGESLEAAGFVNITKKVYKAPVGIWPANKTLRLIGMYMRKATEGLLGAAAAKPFQTLGMTEQEISDFMDKVAAALRDRSVHTYGRYYVWTAQKPRSTAN